MLRALTGGVAVALWCGTLAAATTAAPDAVATVPTFGTLLRCTSQTPTPPAPKAPGDYYTIDLVPTGRVPGTATSKGLARVSFAASPFGIAVSPDGSYEQSLEIRTDPLPQPQDSDYVVWTASSELDRITRIGTLGTEPLRATVGLNKFLVVISLESAGDVSAEKWKGPIVMRGMSRSGLMHTLAGHGPFQLESCLKYGYGGLP